jgi:glycosyltransferase involved in cell wall biosynthesis
MAKKKKHILIDARIRQASTGRPVARLLEHLQEIDNEHRYTILLKKGDDWTPTNKNFSAIYSRFPLFSFNPLNQVLFAWQLYKQKADLTYFTMTPQQPLFYLKKQATFTHDLVMFRFARAGRLPEWLHWVRMQGYRFLMWRAHRIAKHVFVPTEFVSDDVSKRYLFVNRKISVAYNASEPPLPGKAKTPENAPEEFIMYTGSAFPHKNLERLISAFCLLKEHHPKIKLVLVGKREYHSKQLEKWAKRYSKDFIATSNKRSKRTIRFSASNVSNNTSSAQKTTVASPKDSSAETKNSTLQRSKQDCYEDIIFTGFIPDEELKWYYQNARAYVFPTLSEGFGLPSLEAMVHGCPVVASNISCLPEVNGDAAHYFNPEDIQDIAHKIDEVISNERLRSKLIKEGYENVKRFSWRRTATIQLSKFKELLNED